MKKKQLRNIAKWLVVGILISILAHFIIELLYFGYDFRHVVEQIFNERPTLFIYGTSIIFIIYILFTSVFGSTIIGAIIISCFAWIIGVATKLKTVARAEPLYPNDVYWLSEIPFLFKMVGTQNTVFIILGILIAIVALFLTFRYRFKNQNKYNLKMSKAFRISGSIVSIGLLIYISRFNYPGNIINEAYAKQANWAHWEQQLNYNRNGFVAGFLYNLDSPPMEPLNNYSRDTIEELFEEYQNKADIINRDSERAEQDANILYVMNESFSDPFNLEGIESNIDPLTNYREIIKKYKRGNLIVRGFGGDIATNDFQFLTCISVAPLYAHITSPFIQLTGGMHNYPSIVEKVNNLGYKSTVIHVYVPHFYKRQEAYNELKFDDFIYPAKLRYKERPSDTHPYVSDFSAYQEVLDVLSETPEKDFIHLVTMQNHGGYTNKYQNIEYEVSGSGNPEEANPYFKDLENSDYSLNYLIDQINEYPEPILLVFWGDHLPGFYKDEAVEENSVKKLHETPFLIYSNEIDLEENMGLTSLIYLNNYFTSVLCRKVTAVDALL